MEVSSIALIGYRGSGKTAVAQLLAARLGWEWVDADVEVEARRRQVDRRDLRRRRRNARSATWRRSSSTSSASAQQTVIALGGGRDPPRK